MGTLHEHISAPKRKEIRWFTRGEFDYRKLADKQKLTLDTSIYDFTSFFDGPTNSIQENPGKVITLDGGFLLNYSTDDIKHIALIVPSFPDIVLCRGS